VSTPPPVLMPVFATPFAVVPLPAAMALNAQLLALFQGRASAAARDPRVPADALCFRGRDDLFEWPDGPVQELKAQLLGALVAIVAEANQYNDAELDELRVQARAWFTIVQPDGSVPAMSYPLASWCGIYCVDAPEPNPLRVDSGVLRLYGWRVSTMYLDDGNCRLHAPFSQGHHQWRPVPGSLALFPGALLHEIALVRGSRPLALVTVRARFARSGQQAPTGT
jgi:hypothetical protein